MIFDVKDNTNCNHFKRPMTIHAHGPMFEDFDTIKQKHKQLYKEDFEKIIDRRIEKHQQMKENMENGEFPPFKRHFKEENNKKRLEPLSIRVKPHTKKFLKEESPLTPREILELYEDFASDKETFINSLIEDEEKLQKELEEIQTKIENAKAFNKNLKENTDE